MHPNWDRAVTRGTPSVRTRLEFVKGCVSRGQLKHCSLSPNSLIVLIPENVGIPPRRRSSKALSYPSSLFLPGKRSSHVQENDGFVCVGVLSSNGGGGCESADAPSALLSLRRR